MDEVRLEKLTNRIIASLGEEPRPLPSRARLTFERHAGAISAAALVVIMATALLARERATPPVQDMYAWTIGVTDEEPWSAR